MLRTLMSSSWTALRSSTTSSCQPLHTHLSLQLRLHRPQAASALPLCSPCPDTSLVTAPHVVLYSPSPALSNASIPSTIALTRVSTPSNRGQFCPVDLVPQQRLQVGGLRQQHVQRGLELMEGGEGSSGTLDISDGCGEGGRQGGESRWRGLPGGGGGGELMGVLSEEGGVG